MIKRPVLIFFSVLFLFCLAGCNGKQETENSASHDMQILFINVGKADSALICFKDSRYLIDTGSAKSLPRLLRALHSRGVTALDGVFLTHTHEDHIGGLDGLLKAMEVKAVYASEISENKKNGTNAMDVKAQAAGKTVKRLKKGDEIVLSAVVPEVKFSVVGPITYNAEDDNDNSLVLYLRNASFSCLFTGDMQFAEEKSLLNDKSFTPCTVLKVGNHGNKDASSREFISAVSPEYAVISTDSLVDKDTPAPVVLSALDAAGAKVFVTQDAKTGILVTHSGGETKAEAFAAPEAQAAQGLTVTSLDKEAEKLVLQNTSGNPIDLSGGWILSERGGETFFFPGQTVVEPNAMLTVISGKENKAKGLYWEEKNVWHDKKTDVVIVYDAMGNELCRLEA